MEDDEAKRMIQEAEIIMTNLENYPFIKKFFGSIIKQRLQIECFTHGMLTAHLLEPTELTKCDLERLGNMLKLGETYCTDFKHLFRGNRLPQTSEIADAKIIDLLAEVKAFEFLHIKGFSDISHIMRQANVKTVDFIARRGAQDFAIEVTRLGLAQSKEKQPKNAYIVDTMKYTKCEDANGFRISMKTEGSNVCRIVKEISDAIKNKYDQIDDFCQRGTDKWKGVLIISSGRDYFVMGKYENKEYEDTPKKDFLAALTKIWKEREGQAGYLHHIVITRGKDLAKAIIYPSFSSRGVYV